MKAHPASLTSGSSSLTYASNVDAITLAFGNWPCVRSVVANNRRVGHPGERSTRASKRGAAPARQAESTEQATRQGANQAKESASKGQRFRRQLRTQQTQGHLNVHEVRDDLGCRGRARVVAAPRLQQQNGGGSIMRRTQGAETQH